MFSTGTGVYRSRCRSAGSVLGLRIHGVLLVGHSRGDIGNGSVITVSVSWSSFWCSGSGAQCRACYAAGFVGWLVFQIGVCHDYTKLLVFVCWFFRLVLVKCQPWRSAHGTSDIHVR